MLLKVTRGKMNEAQWRAARALVGWSQGDLAQKIGASALTIKRLEAGVQNVSDDMKERAMEALEAAGVEFTNGGQPGVRMTMAKQCSNTLVELARLPDSVRAIQGAKRAIEDYAAREHLGIREATDRVLLLYRDDAGSRTPAGDDIFKWMEAVIIGTRDDF
jgi:transcriptional regulator with XRE-family HTH domain